MLLAVTMLFLKAECNVNSVLQLEISKQFWISLKLSACGAV